MNIKQSEFERLCSELKLRGIAVADFQKRLKVKSQHWNNWKTRGIPANRLFVVANELKINPSWLASGSGNKTIAQGNDDEDKRNAGYVPMVSWLMACEPIKRAEDWIICPVNHSDDTFALTVESDSMVSPYPGQKSYLPGSIIFVDPTKQAHTGCRVIARIKDKIGVVFKEYQQDGDRGFLKSLNPGYPVIEMDEHTEICGVVIGQFQTE